MRTGFNISFQRNGSARLQENTSAMDLTRYFFILNIEEFFTLLSAISDRTYYGLRRVVRKLVVISHTLETETLRNFDIYVYTF
jgi:hypothetical protein